MTLTELHAKHFELWSKLNAHDATEKEREALADELAKVKAQILREENNCQVAKR